MSFRIQGFTWKTMNLPLTGGLREPSSSRIRELARSVQTGQQLELSGQVKELGTKLDKLTALVDVSGYQICTGNVELPQTRVELPLDSAAREALEGMRVLFPQTLTLTDVYNLARGELTLSSRRGVAGAHRSSDAG